MSHLVCSWLGLPSNNWPPDHYTLLGLKPGESDQNQIEERVHERLMRLRQYQLNHPEEVTEAMNRLARAFSCLTDPAAKKAYDAWLSGPRTREPAKRTASDTSADPLAWLFGPWSGLTNARSNEAPTPAGRLEGRSTSAPAADDGRSNPTAGRSQISRQRYRLPGCTTTRPDGCQCTAGARAYRFLLASGAVFPGTPRLTTRRALYHRMRVTHRLIRAWEQAGKYVNRPGRRLVRPRERRAGTSTALGRSVLGGFPSFAGEAWATRLLGGVFGAT